MAEPVHSRVPVPARRGWRRALRWCGAGLAIVALAVVTLDYWLPPLAERAAAAAGVSVGARETRSGRVVVWRDVAWRSAGVEVGVRALTLDAPTRMLRRGGRTDVAAEGWVVKITPTAGASAPAAAREPPVGWPETWDRLRDVNASVRRWVGAAGLRDGRLEVAGENLGFPDLKIADDRLAGRIEGRGRALEFEWAVQAGTLVVNAPDAGAEARLALGRERVDGNLTWRNNRATLAAEFAPGAWRPTRLRIGGEDWAVPAAGVGLGTAYGDLRGRFALREQGEGVALEVVATAEPLTAGYPAVRVDLAGEVAADRFRVERLALTAPQARASLSGPLEWRAGDGWAAEDGPEFDWEADLEALSAGRVSGRAQGWARWVGGTGPRARVVWSGEVTDGAWRELRGLALELQGESDVGETRVEVARLTLPDGGRVEASGRLIHVEETRIAEAKVVAELVGGGLRPWLPAGVELGAVRLEARGGGVWPQLDYEGVVTVSAPTYAGWAADAVRLDATGSGTKVEKLEIKAERGGAELTGWFAGDLARGLLGGLSWRRSDGVWLESKGFAGGGWDEGKWRLGLHLASPPAPGDEARRLRVAWERGGTAALEIRNLDTSWLADWRTGPAGPDIAVRALELEASPGTEGFFEGGGSFDLAWRRPGAAEFWARGEVRASQDGFVFPALEAGQGGESLLRGEGGVPWRWRTGPAGGWAASPDGRWSLRLASRADATRWDELAKLAGLELEGPAFSVALDGPAAAPRGEITLAAERVGFRGEGLPEGGVTLLALRARASLAPGAITLDQLAGEIDGQRLRFEGRLALAEGDWARLRARPFVWLRDHAEGRLRIPEAEVAALARYLPTLLAPAGTLAADLRLSPGARLDGAIMLRGAASRPLGGFGVLQEVDLELALSGLDVRIARLRAMAGGQAVEITGGARREPGRLPVLDLAVKAERFPLVRRPGLLLRGDLDLTIKTDAERRTRLAGAVRLRDSLFLADIRPLIASSGGSASAARARPPYFSVETKPLAEWELAVRVGGERFLRLRTPVFNGVVSADFDLSGTLREPRAAGEARVDSGVILFPFASFAVQEGTVRLRRADPFSPALDFRASGRRLGYDLRLELGGTVDAPQLQLFSSPPLEAENLLLMVTAGAAPVEGRGAASAASRLAAMGAYVGRDLLRTAGLGGSDEERLSLSSGEKVSRQGRETYGFDYRLDDVWSLTGEYDEFDAYNVGVKRRLGPADSGAPGAAAVTPDGKETAR